MTPYPKIVIYGQYKTGTTACFIKIRDSLSCAPREIFEESEYIPHPDDNFKPLLAKVIIPPNPNAFSIKSCSETQFNRLIRKAEIGLNSFETFDKKILLIRDPRDWIISGALFLPQAYKEIYNDIEAISNILELIHKKELSPKTVSFIEIMNKILSYSNKTVEDSIPELISGHHRYIFDFEKKLNNYVRWRYEDMVENKSTEIEKYFGFKFTKSDRPDERFKHVPRTKSYGNWRDWFTPSDVEFFKPLMSEYIENYAYDMEWRLNLIQQINPEHASKYVENTVSFKRESVITSVQIL
jgi:hypothetical protein